MKKRTLACLLAGILAVGSLAGCGKKEEQTSGAKTESGYAKNAKLKVWGSQEDQEMYKKMIEEFQKEIRKQQTGKSNWLLLWEQMQKQSY